MSYSVSLAPASNELVAGRRCGSALPITVKPARHHELGAVHIKLFEKRRGAVWKPASPFRSKSRRSSSLNVTEFLPFGGARDAPPVPLAPGLSVSRRLSSPSRFYGVSQSTVTCKTGHTKPG